MDALLTELMTLTHDLRRAHARAATDEDRRRLRRMADMASSALDRALVRAGQLAPQRVACDAAAVAAALARDLTDAGVPGVHAPPDAMPLMVGGDPLRIARALHWAAQALLAAAPAPPDDVACAAVAADGGAGGVALVIRWRDPRHVPVAPPDDPDAAALAALLGGALTPPTVVAPDAVQIAITLPPPPTGGGALLTGWTACIIAAPATDVAALQTALAALGAAVQRSADLADVLARLDPATPAVIALHAAPDPATLALLQTLVAVAPLPRLLLADPSLAIPAAAPLPSDPDPVALAAAVGVAVRRAAAARRGPD